MAGMRTITDRCHYTRSQEGLARHSGGNACSYIDDVRAAAVLKVITASSTVVNPSRHCTNDWSKYVDRTKRHNKPKQRSVHESTFSERSAPIKPATVTFPSQLRTSCKLTRNVTYGRLSRSAHTLQILLSLPLFVSVHVVKADPARVACLACMFRTIFTSTTSGG